MSSHLKSINSDPVGDKAGEYEVNRILYKTSLLSIMEYLEFSLFSVLQARQLNQNVKMKRPRKDKKV